MTIYGRSEELVSRCVECNLAEPESLASLGDSAPGVVDGILSITKHIPLCDSSVHAGTPFSVPSSSSETNRVSNRHSSLVTTPSSRMILGKPKIEVTKVLTHTSGKNGKHFYWEKWHNTTKNGENSECSSILVTKNLMHHAGRNGEHPCVPFNLNNTSCGFMLDRGLNSARDIPTEG